MKATIYVNRHIVRANKKASKESGVLVDAPAITVKTYLGTIVAKEVELTIGGKLIQDAFNAHCSGATIWLETQLEGLIIDGQRATKEMFL